MFAPRYQRAPMGTEAVQFPVDPDVAQRDFRRGDSSGRSEMVSRS